MGTTSLTHRGEAAPQCALAPVLLAVAWLAAAPAGAFTHQRLDAAIPMRDGRTLAADVWLPAATGAWPAVLVQTPYDRRAYRLVFPLELSRDPLLKSPDYAFVVLDWRGFFGSADAAAAGSDIGRDGFDAVEWIAAQPWCDGRVGTWGASALAVAQFATAAERPPHLRAAVPIVGHARNEYRLYYPGGVYARNKNTFVAGHFGGGAAIRDHPFDDATWALAAAAGPDPEQIDVPMLHVSGWYDHQTAVSIAEARAIRDRGGPAARAGQWLLLGPWSHGAVGRSRQGELDYPAAEHESSRAALVFFDRFLRGLDGAWEAQPFVRYFQLGEDRWEGAADWPPAAGPWLRLHLHADGSLAPAATAPSSRSYLADPADPVPSLFGAILIEGPDATQGPGDLAPLLARPDVLAFTTPVLGSALRLAGDPVVRLEVGADAIDTDLAVRLAQVTPDGRTLLLVDGIRRVSLRDSYAVPDVLVPGEVVPVEVELSPIAVTIPAGHRLRLLVAPSNFDHWDVNPQDGSSLSDAPGAVPTPAVVTLYLGGGGPACLDLPLSRPARARRAGRAAS